MSLSIIRATLDHLDLAAPLFDGYRQFYEKPSDLAGARQFIQDRLTHHQSVIFLALLDDQAVGFTQLYPSFSSVSMKRLWVLNDLFVAPAGRRQGVGEGLLERARQFAADDGAKGLMLETAITNTTAQKLYERLGWVRDTEYCVYNLTL
ncbi:MAG: GNAT family N-acetyltransferase [Chloroflexi bacterium]|nr:GNAT family N-acetyltransferase [Chloroflexota bacterium]MCC6893370.1 GNAT family N-acetyltransferase [Anaerolineae bacterium]